MKPESLDNVNRLAEQVGNILHFWGFKSIYGRIWLHLYISPQPLDAPELVARLHISKALFSITVTDLLKYDVVRLVGTSERDTRLYEANPDVHQIILKVLRSREQKMLEDVAQAQQQLESFQAGPMADDTIRMERVQAVGRMIREAQTILSAILCLQAFDFKNFKLR